MIGYFQNLIERISAPSQAIRPRLPAYFEPRLQGSFTAATDFDGGATEEIRNITWGDRADVAGPSDLSEATDRKPATGHGEEGIFLYGLANQSPLERRIGRNGENPSRGMPHGKHSQPGVRTTAESGNIIVHSNDGGPGRAAPAVSPHRRTPPDPLTAGLLSPPREQQADRQRSNVQSFQIAVAEADPPGRLPGIDAGGRPKVEGEGGEKHVSGRVLKQPHIQTLFSTPSERKSAQPSFQIPVQQQTSPERTIKVSIGRIEVRAVMAQAPLGEPPVERKGERKPRISLEDYLKKQRGGSR